MYTFAGIWLTNVHFSEMAAWLGVESGCEATINVRIASSSKVGDLHLDRLEMP